MANDRSDIPSNPIEIIEGLSGITEGLGEWVAGPVPSNPVAAAIQGRYRDQCDSYSNGPTWFVEMTAPAKTTMSNLCDPWLGSQGSGPPVGVPGGPDPNTDGVKDYSPVGGATWDFYLTSNPASARRRSGLSYTVETFATFRRYQLTNCNGSQGDRLDANLDALPTVVVSTGNCDPSAPEDFPPEVGPNPNPRPDPGLDPEDYPFEREPGRPVFPMPEIPNPFGDPVRLPNFPAPPLFGTETEGPNSNPNVGPPVAPGSPQTGVGAGGDDDDFGDPPEGHQWVGFVVKLSDQGVTEGLQPGSPPQPIYRAVTGNYRGKYSVDGQTVYSTPREIKQETSAYFLELPGLTLVGARVNVPPNDSYVVTPLSQPVTDSDEPQQV